MPELTEEQFLLIARLMRSRGLSREAAHRVLVLGERQCATARDMGVDPHLVAVTISIYREVSLGIRMAFVDQKAIVKQSER